MRKLEFTEQSTGEKTATLRSRALQKVQLSIQQSTDPSHACDEFTQGWGKTGQKEKGKQCRLLTHHYGKSLFPPARLETPLFMGNWVDFTQLWSCVTQLKTFL